jgi:hypothetical protein
MTDPQQPVDDTTVTDGLVQPTDNGPRDDDPDEQPPQDPEWLPPGTTSEVAP